MDDALFQSQHLVVGGSLLMLCGVATLVTAPRFAAYGVGALAVAFEVVVFGALQRPDILIPPLLILGLALAADTYTATLRTWFFRASQDAVWGAMVGSLVVLLIFYWMFSPAIGFLVGLFFGAIIGEMRTVRDPRALLKIGLGTVMGVLGPMALKLIFGIMLIGHFTSAALGALSVR